MSQLPERPQDPSALDDADRPFFTIGQVSALLGVRPAVLRRIEEQDVVSPGRSEGGQRRYSRNEVELLREVLELTEEGLTLAAVRKVLDLRKRVSDLEDALAGRGSDAAG